MKRWVGFSLLLSVLLGAARWADLLLWTDSATGLCTVGSVWWRYGGLALASAFALLAGRKAGGSAEPLLCRRPAAGVPALMAGVLFGLTGAQRLLLSVASAGVGALVRKVLELLCGGWLLCLGWFWLAGEKSRPTRKIGWAIAGSILFYWTVLERFMLNSSSWHRVGPTAAVWQQLTALLFLAALVRALYLPGQPKLGAVCGSGLLAFCLCLCWGLPQAAVRWAAGELSGPALWFELGLCAVGALGAVCAIVCIKNAPKAENARQDG